MRNLNSVLARLESKIGGLGKRTEVIFKIRNCKSAEKHTATLDRLIAEYEKDHAKADRYSGALYYCDCKEGVANTWNY